MKRLDAPMTPDPNDSLAYQSRLRALSVRKADVYERERKQLSKDLHDQVSHELGLARIKLSQVLRGGASSVDTGSRRQLEQVEDHLKQAVRRSRNLGQEYCPQILYDAGFVPAVQWLAEHYGELHGLPVDLRVGDGVEDADLSPVMAPRLYTALRECLLNAYKYAKASHVRLTVERINGDLSFTVADDGKGFDVASLDNPKTREGGFGLFSLREMIGHLGGEFTCESTPDEGTTIQFYLPMNVLRSGNPDGGPDNPIPPETP